MSEAESHKTDQPPSEAAALAEYAEAGAQARWLAEVRFKLLSLLPLSTLLGVLGARTATGNGAELGIGLFGACITLCLFVYHLRNDQLYQDVVERLEEIEEERGLLRGAFFRRVPTWSRFLGLKVEHGWPIRVIYFASFTAWILLATSGIASDSGDVGLIGGPIAGGALLGGTILYGHRNQRNNAVRIEGVNKKLREFLVDGKAPEDLAWVLMRNAPHLVDSALRRAGLPLAGANSSTKLNALVKMLGDWRADNGQQYPADPDEKAREMLGIGRSRVPAPTRPLPTPQPGAGDGHAS